MSILLQGINLKYRNWLIASIVVLISLSVSSQENGVGVYYGYFYEETVGREGGVETTDITIVLIISKDGAFTLDIANHSSICSPGNISTEGTWREKGDWIYFEVSDGYFPVMHFNDSGRKKNDHPPTNNDYGSNYLKLVKQKTDSLPEFHLEINMDCYEGWLGNHSVSMISPL
ncbi:MAG: hypothetical protein QNK23_08680 [Crocinitomicaceae bacterium]|nr:hypothetical protein [Crocinitomicaceae bacterium]